MPLSGLHATKATNLCAQLLPRLRGAHGQQLLCSVSLSAGPVPWSHCHANSLPPPPDHHRHPPHPSIIPLPRAAPDATPGLQACAPPQAVVRIVHMSRHWLKPAILRPGVSSAVATVRVLRFSAMIIGPSSLVAPNLTSEPGAATPKPTSRQWQRCPAQAWSYVHVCFPGASFIRCRSPLHRQIGWQASACVGVGLALFFLYLVRAVLGPPFICCHVQHVAEQSCPGCF